MHKIIRQIVKERGNAVITSAVLVNCMDDVAAFESVDHKIFKKILRAVIKDGYSQKLLNIGQWNEAAKLLITEYAQKNALSEEYVSYIFKCLAYGLGWLRTNPTPPTIDPAIIESKKQVAAKTAKKQEQKAKREQYHLTQQKAKEELEDKRRENIAYTIIGLAWIIWLAGTIYGIFFLSDGFWETAITISLEGGIAYLLAYGSMFIDCLVEDIDSKFVSLLGVGFILAVEVALHHLVYLIIFWL